MQTELFSEIEPHYSGLIPVYGGHEIYFEECGNPKGVPVLVFHGGPGAGGDTSYRRYFDPKKFRIVLYDQRGCGRSQPSCKLKNNKTKDLIQDAKQILNHLEIKKAILYGGSWGSTMALLFAITYPEVVLGMVLRGIFLGESSEIDYSEHGLIAQHFPKDWARFASVLNPKKRKDPLRSYYKEIISKSISTERKRKLAYEWSLFEDSHLSLCPVNPKKAEEDLAQYGPELIMAIGMLELHYLANNCFIKPGFIINNALKIPNVPISIVHGVYDTICPARSAYRLETALTTSGHNQVRAFYTFASHSKSDPENQKRLLSETELMYEKVKAAL